MKRKLLSGIRITSLAVGLIGAAMVSGISPRSGVAAANENAAARAAGVRAAAYTTAKQYVETFYPLWFTYYQSKIATTNKIAGPATVTHLYQIVVAINVDTVYASTFLDLTTSPVILKVPQTPGAYSVLALDPYGTVFKSAIPSQPPGTVRDATTYVIYGPDYDGALPPDATPVPMPHNHMLLIFRADKFSPEGVDQQAQAEAFRAALFTQPLCAFLNETCPDDVPEGGFAVVLPEIYFAEPFKLAADFLAQRRSIQFLAQLQRAVKAPNTPPLSEADQALSDAFDQLFGDGSVRGAVKAGLVAGTKAAHKAIIANYENNRGPTNWIHFTNIGNWGSDVLDRSSITEYIQYGNDIEAAAYYQAFRDVDGRPLNGRKHRDGYVLTFPAGEQPDALRFWSVTAYTPNAIELVENPDKKYHVARYTPGLVTNSDGSVSIYMSPTRPDGVAQANWLPVPRRPFNIMIRVYGPQGTVADNTYVPPGIEVNR